MSATAFDNLASQYDLLWTRTTIGHLQREAVWRGIASLFKPGQTVLDLGCGTGEDAVRLMDAGLRVHAIDASPEMVRIARGRGIDAEVLPIENCGNLERRFDAVLLELRRAQLRRGSEILAGAAQPARSSGRLSCHLPHRTLLLVGDCVVANAGAAGEGIPFGGAEVRCRHSGFRVFYPSRKNS